MVIITLSWHVILFNKKEEKEKTHNMPWWQVAISKII